MKPKMKQSQRGMMAHQALALVMAVQTATFGLPPIRISMTDLFRQTSMIRKLEQMHRHGLDGGRIEKFEALRSGEDADEFITEIATDIDTNSAERRSDGEVKVHTVFDRNSPTVRKKLFWESGHERIMLMMTLETPKGARHLLVESIRR